MLPALRRVLTACVNYEHEMGASGAQAKVGYCQGMNCIAGFLLLVFARSSAQPERDAFHMLVFLLFKRGFRELYLLDKAVLSRYEAAYWRLLGLKAPLLHSRLRGFHEP